MRALVGNQVVLILVDSGSSHTFVNANLLPRAQLSPVSVLPLSVKVANGQVIQCTEEVKALQWWLQGHTFQMDAKVIPLGAYDIILGMDWVENHNPMTCDWKKKWIEFSHNDQKIRLLGIPPQDNDQVVLREITGEQLYKMHKGNDI